MALLGSGLVSDVRAGENRGRHLIHEFTALSLVDLELRKTGNNWEGSISVPGVAAVAGERGIAAWVTQNHGLEPVQAVGGWIGQ